MLGTSICLQVCINTVGSYTCACGAGYKLDADNHTCNGKFILDTPNWWPLLNIYNKINITVRALIFLHWLVFHCSTMLLYARISVNSVFKCLSQPNYKPDRCGLYLNLQY